MKPGQPEAFFVGFGGYGGWPYVNLVQDSVEQLRSVYKPVVR
jgi:hypothetical protein